MRNIIILFITFVFSPVLFSQEAPVLSGDAFITLAGDWDAEYIMSTPEGGFDTVGVKIDAVINTINRGLEIHFTFSSPGEESVKLDTDLMVISEDGRQIDMGSVWTITEIVEDHGDTILLMDRKELGETGEIHYLRSILRAGPDMFAFLTAVKRNEGEDYILEEQYRFTRKK